MRLANKDVEKRLHVQLNKSIKGDNDTGIMMFGKKNDYPQIIENLIFGSQTAKACANIFARFIAGDGFQNDQIGKVKVGVDSRGKPITLDNIRRGIGESLAKFYGVYIHCNESPEGKVGNTRIIPFKNCRLSKQDDQGFCGKIAVHPNWTAEKDLKIFKNKDIVWFPHFNLDPNVLKSNYADEKGFKGQVYSLFIDDNYLYPLSPFDSVYLDMDTEYQVQLFKNREVREGMSDKAIVLITPSTDEKEAEETRAKVKAWSGPDGGKILVLEAEPDEDGNFTQDKNFKVEKVNSNINDKLFENWEQSLANNIRKAIRALPAILIDYEQGKLSTTSGESIIQATNYYNALTLDLRQQVSECIRDIYSHHDNDILSGNSVWDIKDVSLYKPSLTPIQNVTS